MRRFSFVGTFLVALTLLAGLAWVGISLIDRSFVPDGTSDDTVTGLSGETTITRDEYGVAYITAPTENDAYAALGYAHAQDRLWQMDLLRRAGAGRLSEIFGKKTVGSDVYLKTIGFDRVAREILKSMPKRTRATLDAYCRGVNAYIASHQDKLPFEFDALGYRPEPWTPEHSVMISRLLAWELNTSFWTDVVYGEIQRRVDSAKFAEILPYYPSDAPTIIPGGQKPEPLLEQFRAGTPPPVPDSLRNDSTTARRDTTHAVALFDVMELDRTTRRMLGMEGAHIGSNAWVVTGARTASGKPILANDPHLSHSAPSKWYQAVIAYKGNTVAGVTLPGTPFVVIGRNRKIAWGITSMMADQTDFYVEQLDSPGKKMLHDGEWSNLQIVRDTIHPKDSLAVPIAIRIGMHGPLISDVRHYAGYLRDPKTGLAMMTDTAGIMATSAVAMRWAGSDPTQEMAAWQRIDEASSLDEFTSAVRLGGVPALSFLYADVAGTIAYVPSARIPVRNGTRLNTPNPGTDSRYNWKGYYDMAKLPTMKNPSSGYIASANNKISNSLAIDVGALWEDPSRAIRLEQLLKEGNNFSRADMVQIQGDLLSPQMRYMVDYLLHAFPDSTRQTPLVRSVISRLRTWDGGMLIDAPEAAIAAVWLQSVVEMTYRDEMGPELYRQFVRMAQLPIRSLRYHTMTDSRWFDDVTTTRRERRDDIFRNALARALDSLHQRFGTWDVDTWRFGAMHTLTFHHPFSETPGLRSIVDIGPFEVGGCNTTLNNGEWRFDLPYDVTVGPSMRQIIDFADTSTFMYSVITSGASGQPMSEAYQNQTILYLSHGYLALQRLPPQGAAAASTTVLRPE